MGIIQEFFNINLNKGEYYDNISSNIFFIGRRLRNGEQYKYVEELETFKIQYF